eukprot:COSAG01_NODE_5407_length_4281_cov_1.613196_1_plen_150_part_00
MQALLEQHPAGLVVDTQLSGLHMNGDTHFESELYLGHALMFGCARVRRCAEQNLECCYQKRLLEGCYQKRLLEIARFMWINGVTQMMRGKWSVAAETLRLAADMKEGLGCGSAAGAWCGARRTRWSGRGCSGAAGTTGRIFSIPLETMD